MKILYDGKEVKSLDLLIAECKKNREFREHLLSVTDGFAKMFTDIKQVRFVTLKFGKWKFVDLNDEDLIILNTYVYIECIGPIMARAFYNAKNR